MIKHCVGLQTPSHNMFYTLDVLSTSVTVRYEGPLSIEFENKYGTNYSPTSEWFLRYQSNYLCKMWWQKSFFRNNILRKESEAYCKRIIEKNEIEMERWVMVMNCSIQSSFLVQDPYGQTATSSLRYWHGLRTLAEDNKFNLVLKAGVTFVLFVILSIASLKLWVELFFICTHLLHCTCTSVWATVLKVPA